MKFQSMFVLLTLLVSFSGAAARGNAASFAKQKAIYINADKTISVIDPRVLIQGRYLRIEIGAMQESGANACRLWGLGNFVRVETSQRHPREPLGEIPPEGSRLSVLSTPLASPVGDLVCERLREWPK